LKACSLSTIAFLVRAGTAAHGNPLPLFKRETVADELNR
jgi:hypothetical protein